MRAESSTAEKMLAVQYKDACSAADLTVGQVDKPGLRDGEILIKVLTTAVNRADTLQRKGLYPPPAGESRILGLEAAGIVAELASKTSGKWKVGDRVMALVPGGGNAEYVAAHEDLTMPVGSGMTFPEAGAVPEVWLTAYQLLHFVGHFRAGDTVLIHAGGSGVGTAAVQIVQLLKGTSIVTAGSQEKIDFAKSLGAKDGFNYKEDDFSEKVLNATNGRGVDLVLDCVGSSFWEKNVASLVVDGRWVLYGLMGGGTVNGDILAKLMRKRITLSASTIRARTVEYKAEVVASFSTNVLPHMVKGQVKPIIYKVLEGLKNMSTAHEIMEKNQNLGKIVVEVAKEHSHSDL